MRIGHGFDVHKFEVEPYTKQEITLGGVKIPFNKGLLAHSDGDVLIHALCDALLGAAALGDIGQHFPDTDSKYKNIDSRKLLQCVVNLLTEKGYTINNVDATVVVERPKLKDYIQAMREVLAADLKVEISYINVKATTTEGLDATGSGLGIAAHAVVTIKDNTNANPN